MEGLEKIFNEQEREIELAKVFLKPLSEASPRPINLVNLLIEYGNEIENTRTLLWKREPVDFNDLFLKLNDARYIDILTIAGEPTRTIMLGTTELRMPQEAKDFFIRNYLERPIEAN